MEEVRESRQIMFQVIKDNSVTSKIMERLVTYVTEFENSGVPFEKIFNNEKIKHDCYDNNFFCYKHSIGRNSYRLLYRFIREAGNRFTIEPHLTIIKRYSARGGNTDYIKHFTKYAKNYKE